MSELALRDKAEIVRLDTEQIKFLAHTEFVPKGIRGNLAAIFATIATGREIGIGDMASLRHVHIIEGKPGYSAEIMVVLARRAGHSIEGEVDAERAVVRGRRADNGDTMTVEWTLDMAKTAGLADKAVWKKYPQSLLWARAVSQLCRMLFADCFAGGTYTPEEIGAEHTDSVGEPEAAEVRGGNPVAVSQPVLDGGEAASPTDTPSEAGKAAGPVTTGQTPPASESVDLSDPDIPFGDAPPDPPKPTDKQLRYLNAAIKTDGPNSLSERVPNLMQRVYATVADIRGCKSEELINTLGAWDATEGRLRWSPLRDSLSKHEASELIDRLQRLEAK